VKNSEAIELGDESLPSPPEVEDGSIASAASPREFVFQEKLLTQSAELKDPILQSACHLLPPFLKNSSRIPLNGELHSV
jgi:hypothetical protein